MRLADLVAAVVLQPELGQCRFAEWLARLDAGGPFQPELGQGSFAKWLAVLDCRRQVRAALGQHSLAEWPAGLRVAMALHIELGQCSSGTMHKYGQPAPNNTIHILLKQENSGLMLVLYRSCRSPVF